MFERTPRVTTEVVTLPLITVSLFIRIWLLGRTSWTKVDLSILTVAEIIGFLLVPTGQNSTILFDN